MWATILDGQWDISHAEIVSPSTQCLLTTLRAMTALCQDWSVCGPLMQPGKKPPRHFNIAMFFHHISTRKQTISTLYSPSKLNFSFLLDHSILDGVLVSTSGTMFLDILQGGAPLISLLEFFPSTEQLFLDQTCTELLPQPAVLRWRRLNTPTVLCLYRLFIAHNTAIYG